MVCHFHTTYEKDGIPNDFVLVKPTKGGSKGGSSSKSKIDVKVTGVPFERNGTSLLHPSYLSREYGHVRPPKPTSQNRNFTLKRVLKVFPVVDGIHTMHCGCVLNDALIDLFFWKRVKLTSLSRNISEPYKKPMKPHDHLFLIQTLRWIDFNVDLLYSSDEQGTRHTHIDRLELYIKRLKGTVKDLRGGNTKGKKSEGDSKGKGKAKAKKKLEYVEVSDHDTSLRYLNDSSDDERESE